MFANALVLVLGSLVGNVGNFGDHVLTPPEDGRQFATVLCVSGRSGCSTCRDESQLLRWFETEPRLRSLRSTTQFFVYTPQDVMWRDRFARTHNNVFPTIWIQDYSGGTVCKLSGNEIPHSASALADYIETKLAELPRDWAQYLDPDPQVKSRHFGDRLRGPFVPDTKPTPLLDLWRVSRGDYATIVKYSAAMIAVVVAVIAVLLVLLALLFRKKDPE